MKLHYKIANEVIASLILVVGLFGCSNFEDLNTSKTSSSNMDPNLQLPTVQFALANDHQEWHRYFIYPMGFMQQWSGDWSVVEYGGKAKKNNGFMSQMWGTYYPAGIKNLVDMVERTKDKPDKANINAVSRIMKVYLFSLLTDFYGDIPYFNAGAGYYTGVLNPKYDKQEDIYKDFFAQLDLAVKNLNPNGDPLLYDLFYNGSITKWKKFANSLHLRLAMRLVKVDPVLAQQEAEKAISAGVMESNDDICFLKYENVQNPSAGGGTGNAISNRLLPDGITSTFRLTKELVGYMEDTHDPRIPMYGGCYLDDKNRTDVTKEVLAARGGLWKTLGLSASKFIYEEAAADMNVAVDGKTLKVTGALQMLQPSKLITAYDAPFVHLSYAEVEFYKAEAAVRGWNAGGGTASEHFAKALQAGVEQMALFGALVTPEMSSNFVAQNPLKSGKELEQINTELWVLQFLNPFETWANWRRSGYPDLKFPNYTPAENQSNGQIPRRMEYPINEQVINPESYKDAVNRMGGKDDWLNRVWWDKQ